MKFAAYLVLMLSDTRFPRRFLCGATSSAFFRRHAIRTPGLFSLLLLTVACGKEPVKPAPDLLGRWDSQQITGTHYDPSGRVLSQGAVSDQGFYLFLTSDSLHFRRSRDNAPHGSYAYRRQGDELVYRLHPTLRCTIAELTDRTLVLRYAPSSLSPGSYYQVDDHHYAR